MTSTRAGLLASLPRPHHVLRPAAAVLAALALSTSVTGCGLRVGDPVPDALPSASQQEAVRDALARRTVLLVSTAESLLAASPEDPAAPTAQALVDDGAVQLEALGGVWEPYATAVPSPYPTASPVATAAEGASASDLTDVLTEAVAEARAAALGAADADEASLYTALTASWSVSLSALAPEAVTAAPRQASALTEPLPGDLLQAYDAARYALEEVAARSTDEPRDSAAAQAVQVSHLVNASLALGGEDTRLAAYAQPAAAEGVSPETEWARRSWTRLASAEVVAAGAATQGDGARAAAVDAAVDAALAASAWGATVPALPGY